jgi:hypothetical protein
MIEIKLNFSSTDTLPVESFTLSSQTTPDLGFMGGCSRGDRRSGGGPSF